MQINSNFPVQSGIGRLSSSKAIEPFNQTDAEKKQFSLPISPLSNFEQASKSQGSRFSKIEGLDLMTQEAIASYQATQSLAADNPRNYLIGVDVFA